MHAMWTTLLQQKQDGGGLLFPPDASTIAPRVDWLFQFIMWVAIFFFVLIAVLLVTFVIKYRRREGVEPGEAPTHNTGLEIAWSVVPLLIVTFIFILGFTDYMDMRVPPQNAYEIQVTGMKWKWAFTYPNGYVSDELHVPIAKPVRLVMTSEDVIHSLYLPAFRTKMDVVPGRYTTAWFEATKLGRFDVFCAEYCGTKHSEMTTSVVVHEGAEFDAWLEKASNFIDQVPPVDAGRRLFSMRGCTQCHSVDGRAGIGPSLLGTFGGERAFQDGSRGVVDENYIRQSVLEPQAKVVAGFQPVMPTYKGRLKDKEITVLIEYLKSLRQ